MSKLMLVVGLLASVTLFDPMIVLSQLGPQANLIGWKIKTALDPARMSVPVAILRRN